MLAKERGEVCRIFGFDVFHYSQAKALKTNVNSVSLQPFFAPIWVLASTRTFALTSTLEPNEAKAVMLLLDK